MWSRHLTTALTLAAATALTAPTASAAPATDAAPTAPQVAPARAATQKTAALGTCTLTPTPLPLPTGTTDGVVNAGDSGGGYAGVATGGGGEHAVRWSGGKVADYGDLPGLTDSLTVSGVNRDGTVVGYTDDAQNKVHPFRSRGGKLEALAVPAFSGAGPMNAFPSAVNDAGDIVGWAYADRDNAPMVAVMWPAAAPGTVVKVTGGLPTTGQTEAAGIDQDGTVLVNSYPADDPVTGNGVYLWRAGSARKLAVPPGETSVKGYALSNGRVAGEAGTHGVLWDQNGTVVRPDKGALLYAVNRTGRIVGYQPSPFGSQVLGVWQLGTQSAVATLTGTDKTVHVSADDGTLAGSVWSSGTHRTTPTTWRCG
ncbi:hypothetical protein [Streptomyces sp. NPDC056670]|uniref:hypothetical protein n=1 Tax=Streptomyces sp. NPDC056670 TaxID=3345904 RepID=UPI0036C5B324